MRGGFLAAVVGGCALAACGWVAWAGIPLSSQEAVANLAKARDFFGLLAASGGLAWWTPNFLGGTSLAPLWGTVVTFGWMVLWASVFGPVAGAKLAILSCIPIAAATMWAFLRLLSGRDGIAVAGALFYAGAPVLWVRVLWVEHAVVVCTMAVVPLVCWALLRVARRPSALSALLAGALVALLALTYSKAALLAAPALAGFVLWCMWKYCGLASWLEPRVGAVLLAAVVVLGVLPNLPALREAGFAVLFEFGPLEGWKRSFSAKSALHLFDRMGVLSQGFRGDFAASTGAGGFYLGAVPLVLLGAALVWRRRLFSASPELAGLFRVTCGLALCSFWLAHGPFHLVSGTLQALDASAAAADFYPAILWFSLFAQGLVIWWLLPDGMPLRKPFGILLLAIYFLVPGFALLSWLPLYHDIRAPFDFFQVAGLAWSSAAAAIAAGMLYGAVRSALWRATALAVLAGVFGLDFAGHLRLAADRAVSADVARDFREAAGVLAASPKPGKILVLSGRYFYLELPALTGRGLVTEAFQGYLQQRGYAAAMGVGYASTGELIEFLRLAGVGFVVVDRKDPDLPQELAGDLEERLPAAAANEHFLVLEVQPSLAPGYVGRDAVMLSSSDPSDIAAGLVGGAADFVAIGPVLPGSSMGTIANGTLDLDSTDSLRGRPFERLAPEAVRQVGTGRIEVEAPSGPGWLVVPEAWHPDWRVVGEEGFAASRAFGAFLAAGLPEVAGPVVFVLRPPWWYGVVLPLSGLGWLAFAGILAVPALRRRLDADTRAAPVAGPPSAEPLRAVVICPTYCEAESLPALLEQIFASCDRFDVLVVDDSSPDGTAALVRDHPLFGTKLHLIERPGKLGLGSAYRDGFRWAAGRGYTAYAEIDADLSHDPQDLPRLLDAVESGADAAIGSRYLGGLRVVNWPEHRLLLSSFATQFVRFVTGMPLTDATSGFKVLRRSALERLDWTRIRAEGYGFQVELHHALWKSGARMVEVPIVFTERREGQTKMTPGIALEAMVRVVELALPAGRRRGRVA